MYRATVSKPLEFTGPSPFFPGNVSMTVIKGCSGISFQDQNGIIDYDLSSLQGHQAKSTARYLKLDNGAAKIRVAEHLLSAFHLAGVTDALIICPKSQVPTCGSGIKQFYDALHSNRVQLDVKKEIVRTVKSSEYRSQRNGIETLITVNPSNTLDILVDSGRHPDLIDLNEQPFYIEDVHTNAEDHYEAMPVARIQECWKYLAWNLMRTIGFKGISEDNYIIASPGATQGQIAQQMQDQYQEGRNEYLAHTAVCDFPGELLALGSKVVGSFTLSNTNHILRVEAIKQFYREGVFKVK